MIAIVDYGAGNIKSLKNALDYLEIENILTNDKNEIKNVYVFFKLNSKLRKDSGKIM